MATLKNLTGAVTITVNGTARAFTDYGVPSAAIEYPIIAARNFVFTDPTEPDSIEIVTPPERGKLVARSDGRMSFNYNDHLQTNTMSFTYNRTKDSVTTQVTATITVAANVEYEGGWTEGRWYSPETDANDRVIVDPMANTRYIYCRTSGSPYSRSAIAAYENTANGNSALSAADITRAWVNNNNVNGESFRYGETEAFAVDEEVAGFQLRNARDDDVQFMLLYNYGDTFTQSVGSDAFEVSGRGYSPLHPHLVGAYGTGADPFFDQTSGKQASDIGATSSNIVMQDIHLKYSRGGGTTLQNICFDGVTTERESMALSGGSTYVSDAITVRRHRSIDATMDAPDNPAATTWGTNADRKEGFFLNNFNYMLLDQIFVSGAGWAYTDGYRPDRDISEGKSPNNTSHSVYMDGNGAGAYFKDCILLHGSHSTIQARCGAIVSNGFGLGHNTGFAPIGTGAADYASLGGRGTDGANWSMVHRFVQTEMGRKDYDGASYPHGGGFQLNATNVSLMDSLVINGGTKTPWSDPTALSFGTPDPDRTANAGNVYFPLKLADNPKTLTPASMDRDEVYWTNWERSINPDSLPAAGSLSEAARDALTINAYENAKTSSSGKTSRDFDTRLRGLDAPWAEIDELNSYFLGAVGLGFTARTVAQTVTFAPDSAGGTPGQLAIFSGDWDTSDLPGTADGDSIDLDGHKVFWSITPENSINNFTFGAGGQLEMWSGALRPTGTINVHSAGNSLNMWKGAKFELAATPAGGVLDAQLCESRLHVSGTVTGNLDLAVIGRSEFLIDEGAAITFGTGRTLEISGNCRAGFDGNSAGAASLTMGAGATLSFKRGAILSVNGLVTYDALASSSNMRRCRGIPRVGDVIEGAISGATGVVAGVYNVSSLNVVRIYVDNIVGSFQNAEQLLGPTWAGPYYIGNSRDGLGSAGGDADLAAIGTINAAPTVLMPQIAEFTSGIYGTGAPSVASTVTLASGSTVTVDTTGLAVGDYDLIVADTLTNSGATLPAGVSVVSGTTLRLTVS